MATPRLASSHRSAVVYGIAAFAWLGLSMWGVLSDCGPRDIDGQCGMSTFFGGAYGILAGALVVVGARVVGILEHYVCSRDRRVRYAGLTSFLAGAAALNVDVFVAAMLHGLRPVDAFRQALGLWILMTFLGAPALFAIVRLVIAVSSQRSRRQSPATPLWACAAGAVAGAFLGVIVALHSAETAAGGAWLSVGGAWPGAVVGWVYWRMTVEGGRMGGPSLLADGRNAI